MNWINEITNQIDETMNTTQKDMIRREALQVKELGNKIGYGHLMSLASALWRKSLKEKGYPESGAFVPTLIGFINEVEQEHAKQSADSYDDYVKYI